MKLEHVIRNGQLKVYVTAPAGTHHSTISGAVWRYIKQLPQPEYKSVVTGSQPGNWCQPQYSGPFKLVGGSAPYDATLIRKTFTSWSVPTWANSKD